MGLGSNLHSLARMGVNSTDLGMTPVVSLTEVPQDLCTVYRTASWDLYGTSLGTDKNIFFPFIFPGSKLLIIFESWKKEKVFIVNSRRFPFSYGKRQQPTTSIPGKIGTNQ